MDIASLGIKITTQGAKESAADLAKLEKQGALTERAADKLRRGWEATGRALGLSLAGGVATAGLLLQKYVANTIEAEKVQAQLAARIKSTGSAAGLAIKDLNDMADALQRATSFDDEAIGGAQGLLLTFTNIGKDVFPRATEATLDMATALGTDLKQAALQVGKALNDPVLGVTALSRAGVQFSESQRDTIKQLVETNRIAEAQAIVLKELETQMGGAARAARDTLGGALAALRNSFDNLLEGDTSEGGLKGTRDTIESLNDSLNDPELKRGIDSLASGLLTAANAAIQAAGKLGGFISEYKRFLADRGLIEGKEVDQLEKRRDKLVSQRKSFFAQLTGSTGEIDKEIARLDNLIAAAPWANVVGGSASTELARVTGGGGATEDKPKAGGSGKSDAARQAEEAARAAREALEAQRDWHDSVLDMAATLAGPAAQAQRDYESSITQLTLAYNEGKVTLADYARAEELYATQRDRALEAIKAQRTPAQQMLEDMQFEVELLGKSRDEQERLTAARYLGAAAATEQGRAALAALEHVQEQTKAIGDQVELLDGARYAARSLFDDLHDGVGLWDSLKDAAGRFADVLYKMASDKLIEQIFGQQGTTQTGSAGGWLSSLGALFGGSTGGSNAWADLFGFASDGFGFADGSYTGRGPAATFTARKLAPLARQTARIVRLPARKAARPLPTGALAA